jgi:5-methylcytosine-specific restriction endonuclease McrA
MNNFDQQYQIQGGRCFWHGALVPVELMTRDHIHPRRGGRRERGGGDYVLACERCNRARSALTIGSLRFSKWLRRVLRGDIRPFIRRDRALAQPATENKPGLNRTVGSENV